MHIRTVLIIAATCSVTTFALEADDFTSALRIPNVSLTDRDTQAAENHPISSRGAKSCAKACELLEHHFPKITSLRGSKRYKQGQAAYWSVFQSETRPWCRVLPKSAEEVAKVLRVVEHTQCQFAVKSGGHAAFAGASNIAGGVTIDLGALNEITLAKDRKTTRVGAGNRWLDVYEKLTPQNLSVVGGRVSGIGVGGLTLGGGISFFSGRHGWACDGVKNYEVVLANSSIVNVNYASHPDLYYALRGGGNNFGIVTRFDLETFPQGAMWGGFNLYNSILYNASLFNAFERFAINAPKYPDAALIMAFTYYQGQYLGNTDLEYAQPVIDPPAFKDFLAIPTLTSTTRITNITDLTQELSNVNPDGLRETFSTATFKNSAVLSRKILDIFVSELEKIKDAANLTPSVVFQSITRNQVSHFSNNGGNALGITLDEAPLTLLEVDFSWSDGKDDDRILAAAKNIVDRSVEEARCLGLLNRYLYQNYASLSQDVFKGYGSENLRKLRKIRDSVDPKRVFQDLQPGYFKIDGRNGGYPN